MIIDLSDAADAAGLVSDGQRQAVDRQRLPRQMPRQNPGESRQDYATPDDFIAAVKRRLNIRDFVVDLAADATNTKADIYIDEATDSLKTDWRIYTGARLGWAWLNPPFSLCEPFAARCASYAPLINVALLVPASVGANWWRDYVDGRAYVLLLNGRMSFDGVGPYPKDCALCLYGPATGHGYEVWDWRK